MSRRALIIGCGFTAQRAARTLLKSGWDVTATSRSPESLAALEAAGARVVRFDAVRDRHIQAAAEGASVLLSVPTLKLDGELFDPTPSLVAALRGQPRHLTYLSHHRRLRGHATGRRADARVARRPSARNSARAPRTRCSLMAAALWCCVRPRYTVPGEGSTKPCETAASDFPRDPSRLVSRIHVDDLAAIVARALQQLVEGAYPVADECPATSADVARHCASLLDLPVPGVVADECLSETRRADRRVDGSAILRLTGLRLRYPSFREGIPRLHRRRKGQLSRARGYWPAGGAPGNPVASRRCTCLASMSHSKLTEAPTRVARSVVTSYVCGMIAHPRTSSSSEAIVRLIPSMAMLPL